MQNSKLLQLLRTFDKYTINRWQQFAYSPYHNKHEDVRTLCDYLHKIYPKLEGKKVERKFLFGKIWGNKEVFRQNRLNTVFSYTLILTENFLIQEQFKKESETQSIYLLEQLRKRQQLKRFNHHLQKLEKQWEQATVRNRNYYHFQFLLAGEKDNYFSQLDQHTHQSIQQRQNSLDNFYFSEKLRDACEIYQRKQLLQMDFSIHFLEEILNDIQAYPKKYQAVPSIMVYYRVYQLLCEQTSNHYYALKELLQQQEKAFPKEELRLIYAHAQNYCIGQINKGVGDFLIELFELYKAQLANELLLEQNQLSEWHYKNIVTVGLRLDAFDWVADFIEDYKGKLSLQSRENAYRFNKAAYCYATQDYSQVLQLLVTVEYSDIRYSLDAKSLLLKAYYDLGENETLFSLCNAFRQYLRRNKEISEFRKEGYYNLLKLTQKTARIRAAKDFEVKEKLQKDLTKLQLEVNATQPIFNVGWLEGKLERLLQEFE